MFFEWTRDWNDIDISVRKKLTVEMLGLDVLKSPKDLHDDMMNHGFLDEHQSFTQNTDYEKSYEWLKSNLEKIRGQTLHDHPHMSLL